MTDDGWHYGEDTDGGQVGPIRSVPPVPNQDQDDQQPGADAPQDLDAVIAESEHG